MLQSLQACRFVAALLVVLHHLGVAVSSDKYFGAHALGVPFAFGGAGVDFFFVLSGFIIALAHRDDVGRPDRLWRYVGRRLARIYPVYLLIFLSVYAAARLSPSLSHTVPHDPAAVFEALALWPQDPVAVDGLRPPVLLVAWSLQYEMAFYAAFGLLILHRGLGVAALLAWGAMFIGCRIGQCTYPATFFALDKTALFLLGMGVYQVTSAGRIGAASARGLVVAGCAGFLASGAVEIGLGTGVLHGSTWFYGGSSAVIIAGLAWLEAERPVHLKPVLLLLGDASYALYLVHYPIISAACKLVVTLGLSGHGGALFAAVLALGVSLGAALAIHLGFERPVARWLRPRGRGAQGG